MRKPAPSSTIFGPVADEADRRPTGGAIHPQIPPSLEVFLVVSPMRLIADQREARYTFKLLPLGNVFGLSCLRPPPTRPASIRTLELEHFRSGACWRPHSINGCCHLRPELNVSVRNLRSGVYSQSPELGDWLLLVKILFLLRCCLPALLHRWPSLTVPQRFIHFPRYPQPMQQNRQLPRHRHHGPLLGVLATTCA
jgi:hypothetical protein